MERGNFEGERGGPLQSVGTLCGELCKTAEPIEMPFGFWACMSPSPRNHVLDGVQIPHRKGQFFGERASIVKYRDCLP